MTKSVRTEINGRRINEVVVSNQSVRQSLFGSSGIRLPFSEQLVSIALNLGIACGQRYPKIMIGHDTRTSGDILKDVLVSGLRAGGATVFNAGVLPTPTLALAARKVNLAIMVTASHNPPEYNGFKLIEPNGAGVDINTQREIEIAIREGHYRTVKWMDIGPLENYETAIKEHCDVIKRDCTLEREIRVVADCCCGAACQITPAVLSGVGCEVIPLNCLPSGCPPRGAEPNESNLSELAKKILEMNADMGIAHDVDADRMMIIDDKGRFVPGDKLLIILARSLGFDDIITTLDASMIIERMGFGVTRTRIGDTYVSSALRGGGSFGGEPSGSWIFPWISLCPDGIYAAAKIASIASRQKISELVDSIPEYPMLRGSIDSDGVHFGMLEGALSQIGHVASICRADGLKIVYDDGWVLIRPSGTEPKIRITIEAINDNRLRTLYQDVMNSINSSCI